MRTAGKLSEIIGCVEKIREMAAALDDDGAGLAEPQVAQMVGAIAATGDQIDELLVSLEIEFVLREVQSSILA